ncbi:transforming acidic coiled-coil-containing protein 2 isoform X4 [Hemicordylus capensis]|uniref:transforming acidic coiled-coil-containing protein 2 isoform X4 n=1 Tax=Hemicordylus capensis TaxID=884348 RepID=UPI002303CBA8|nr:transforming acidic coiled-coil-containing protein 2 isoform X4 [Hemicordylus capensis]
MGNENSGPENQDIPPAPSVPDSAPLPGNEREVKKKRQRKKSTDRLGRQDNLDTLPLDSAASLPLPDNGSSLTAGDTAGGGWPVVSDWKEWDPYQALIPNNLLFAGLDVSEDSGSQAPVISSLSNEALCSFATEELPSANRLAVPPEVTALSHILHEQEEQAVPDFLGWVEETNNGSQPVSVPLVECTKEYTVVSLTSSYDGLPALVPYPTSVNDKHTKTALAVSLDNDLDANQNAATFARKDKRESGNFGLELSSSSDATWLPGARIAQGISSELEPLQQSEQLSDKREANVIPLPESTEEGDYDTTQETSQEAGVLEVGHEEQAAIKLGGQITDGVGSLLMKKETLIPNYSTTGGSDIEKYGAVVDGQSFAEFRATIYECSGNSTTGKGDVPKQAFPEKSGEQFGACATVSNLSLSHSDMPLQTVIKENIKDSLSENQCTHQATSKKTETPLVCERENDNAGLLVNSKPPSKPLSPKEKELQKASTTSEHKMEQADSDGSTTVERVTGETITPSDPENIVNFMKEDSAVDKRLSLGGNGRDFTSESRLPDFIKKENTVPEENDDISLGEGRSQEKVVITSPVTPEGTNLSQTTLLTFDINERQDSPDANWHDYWSSLVNSVKTDASGNSLKRGCGSEYNPNASEEKSPEQQSESEKTATHEREDKSLLFVEAVHLPEEECPKSCELLNPNAEDIALSSPACNMTEEVSLVDVHGSLLLYSENNAVMQNKRDESWEHTFAKRTEWELEGKAMHEITSKGNAAFEGKTPAHKAEFEHQDSKEQAGIAECDSLEKTNIQADTSSSESKKHSLISDDDAVSVPVTAAEPSNVEAMKESNETGHKEYKTEMKSQADDTTLAQKPQSTLDSLQQEQVTEKNDQSMKEDYSDSPPLSSEDTGSQQLKFIFGDLHDSCIRQHNYPPMSDDGEASLETLPSKDVDVQKKADLLISSLPVEQKESSNLCNNQQQSSNTELKTLETDHLKTATGSDEEEPNGTCPQREHSLELSKPSDHQEQCGSEVEVIGNILPKPQTVFCGQETKPNNPTTVADKNALLPSILESMGDAVQDSNFQALIDAKAENSPLKCSLSSKLKQEDSNYLISDSLHEEAGFHDVFAKECTLNRQTGGLCGVADSPNRSNISAAECIPGTEKTVPASVVPQTLLMDFKITCAEDDSKSSRNDLDLPSRTTELAEKTSDIEIKEGMSLVDEIIMKDDEHGKTSFERDVTFITAQEYPPVLSESTSNNTLYRTDSIQKTEFPPDGSQAQLTDLSTLALPCDQHTGVSQQPTNCMNDGIVCELQRDELEVTACQHVVDTSSDLQVSAAAAASPLCLEDTSTEKSTADQMNPEVLDSDNIPSKAVSESGKEYVLPNQGFHSEETVQDSVEMGQFEGSLSPFNLKKLQTEIAAIKTKGANSDENIKAQQCDSSGESHVSFSSLEERLLSLSSLGKQAGCNEGIATNITCTDDKHSEIVKNTGNAEKSKFVFVDNVSIPKMETDIPKQHAETSEKECNFPTSRAFGMGFFDFREHISKIFEKTVRSALTAELPHPSAENNAGGRDSPVVKEIPDFMQVLEAVDGSNENEERDSNHKTEGFTLPLGSGIFNRATQEKIVQEEKPVTSIHEYCLSDTFPEMISIKECLSDKSQMKLHSKVNSSSSSKMKVEESECVCVINSGNQMSLETPELQPAHSWSPETLNLTPASDNELSIMIIAASEDVPKTEFDSTTAAEESNLISPGNAEPGLSKEQLIHFENQCHFPMPSGDKDNKEGVNLTALPALPSLLDDICEPKVQTEQPRMLPGENLLDKNALQDEAVVLDTLGSTKCLQMSVEAQVQKQGQGTAIHGLIDYLKNEVSPDDYSPGDCKPEPSRVSKGCVEEANDTMLSTEETEAHISVDTPKTGITRTLFTDDGDSSRQSIECDQGTDAKKHSEAVQGMEQDVCLMSTDTEVSSAAQCREEKLAHEKFLQDEQGKESATLFNDPKQILSSELQNMSTEGLSEESNFPEFCNSLLVVPEKDAIFVAAKDISDEARDDIRVESVSQPASYQETNNTTTSVPDQRSLIPEPTIDVEKPVQESGRLTEETKRSSDSEEAFETPESTTPVKAAPPLPQLPPEVAVFDIEEQEIRPPLPSEDTGFCSDSVSITDVSHSESIEESPFHPPPHSFSTVFDEDKPIASSGTYNLDFDNIETVDALQAVDPSSLDTRSRDSKAHVRRKSTDSVPISRSTLSRSLSLQAGDFDGASFLGNTETTGSATDTFSTGSSSASSTLKRTKKPRPASLKKKQLAKKSLDVPPVQEPEPTDSKQDSADSSGEKVSEDRGEPTESECTEASQTASEKEEPSAVSAATYPFEPNNFEEISDFSAGESKVQNSPPASKKVLSLTTAPEAVEVTPSDTGGQEDPPVKGLAVRLEFDYSEEKGSGEEQQESSPLPKKVGKKPGAKMPLRRPKTKKTVEKLDNAPTTPTKAPADPNEIPVPKGSYTFDIDKWDDPNFNPFSSTSKIQESPKLPQQTATTYTIDPDICEDSIDPFKPSSKVASSPTKSPASFEIPANASEINGTEGDILNKPVKKKKTPLKTDTFRVKKSPKRSPLSDAPSQESTPLPTAETPSVVSTVVHATDEEKLASSVGNQKWTCMTVDLDSDKQDYPQPSDLSTFVNETKFSSPTEELEYGNSYEIEYMEKIGSSIPQDNDAQTKQSLYLMFDAQQESPVKSPPVRLSDSTTPYSGSSLEETEAQLSSEMKLQHPALRSLTANQETSIQLPDKPKPKELEPMNLKTSSNSIDITTPEDPFVSADALLSRISHPPSMCDQLQYLEPDLAEKNPPIFAQKLQEELEFAAMRIEALKLARQITLSSFSSLDTERDLAASAEVSISKSALYSRISSSDGENTSGLLYQQQDLDSALRIAREEIVAKEREVSEWKEKYEESRREVMEMRKIVSEYEKTIAQMIEDEQREKSMSHHTVQQLIIEKEQALADLNSVEKSLADLFRRYEKMKEVLEGFRKNEEVLKKCAQEYLSRVKKEEQRYQALKIHAEEKLDRANAEIAQVRGKAQQEQAAYQASLRKEQLKVDALERTLEQKNKEIEELTKICDELIAKMGKS